MAEAAAFEPLADLLHRIDLPPIEAWPVVYPDDPGWTLWPPGDNNVHVIHVNPALVLSVGMPDPYDDRDLQNLALALAYGIRRRLTESSASSTNTLAHHLRRDGHPIHVHIHVDADVAPRVGRPADEDPDADLDDNRDAEHDDDSELVVTVDRILPRAALEIRRTFLELHAAAPASADRLLGEAIDSIAHLANGTPDQHGMCRPFASAWRNGYPVLHVAAPAPRATHWRTTGLPLGRHDETSTPASRCVTPFTGTVASSPAGTSAPTRPPPAHRAASARHRHHHP